MRQSKLVVAIDARLVAGASTGDSTYWTGLLHGLAELDAGARIVLFSHTPKPSSPFVEPFEWVHVPGKSSRWWSLMAFPTAARKLGASVLHTQYSLSPLAGRRGITTIHDVSFFVGPQWFRPRDRLLLRATVPAAARRAARVLTVSETSRAEIERFMPAARGKTVVTPLACPPWIQRVSPDEARQRVRALGLEGPVVLTVGTRWPRKNMELAVRALDLLPNDLPHRLAITGKAGWGDSALGARGVAVGYVDERTLSCLYSAADAYLAPSYHEGFGLPVLEAFRCGCPVLCSSGGALPEVVGDAALVERSWEASDWAARLESMLRDGSTLQDLRRRGEAREREFSWRRCAMQTLAVYQEVASS